MKVNYLEKKGFPTTGRGTTTVTTNICAYLYKNGSSNKELEHVSHI
jgi:hypothetical protein